MASPAQRKISCGHIMAGFDNHTKCACCRDKVIGKNPCITGDECEMCEDLRNLNV